MNDVDASASTFCGRIYGLEDVLVDNFASYDSTVQYCIVSHAHADHYKNISLCVPSRVLTTITTRALVPQLAGARCLPVDTRVALEEGLCVAFIPNYHCVGSVMVLIEDSRSKNGETNGPTRRYLYTGDARFGPSVLGALRSSELLSSYIYSDLKLDCLYLDTTFTYRVQIIDIMDNQAGIDLLLGAMAKYPRGTTFCFPDITLGFEEVWYRIQERFKDAKCLFSAELEARLATLRTCPPRECMINVLRNVGDITSATNDTKDQGSYLLMFGSFPKRHRHGEVMVRQAIELSRTDYYKYYTPTEDASIMTPNGELFDGIHRTFDARDPESVHLRFQYFQHGETFFPLELRFMYSCHSSYRETWNFAQLVHANDIWPCTEGTGSRERGLSMLRCYGVKQSKYDQQTFSTAPDQPLVVYNLWDQSKSSSFHGKTVHLEDGNENGGHCSEVAVKSITSSARDAADGYDEVMTDEDAEISVVGRHERIASVQTSLDAGVNAIRKAGSPAKRAQAQQANVRDTAPLGRPRPRFDRRRVEKQGQWLVKRNVLRL